MHGHILHIGSDNRLSDVRSILFHFLFTEHHYESLHGVLDPRKYVVVKQIGCGSCGKVRDI